MPVMSTKQEQSKAEKDSVGIDKSTQVANLFSYACCSCYYFFPEDNPPENNLYMACGKCMISSDYNDRIWTRGYFGCKHHKTDASKAIKSIAHWNKGYRERKDIPYTGRT